MGGAIMTTATAAAPQEHASRSGPNPPAGAVRYVGLTLAWTAIATAAVIGTGAQPTLLAFALALPPALIAIGLAWREGSGAVGRLLRQVRVRPSNPGWYLVMLVPVGAYLAVDAIAVALGEPADDVFGSVFPAVLIVPLVVLVPAFAEEIGWRGFALPRTLTAMSPLRAALVLGIPWALIHVPLYLPGQMNAGSSVWSMVTQVISFSVVLTWIYIGTGGSVLMTGLFHTLLNGLVPLTNGIDPLLAWDIRGIVFPVVAVLLVALGGFRTGRTPDSVADWAAPRPAVT
jgi:membrane protease YdiL (CAAX protease family)